MIAVRLRSPDFFLMKLSTPWVAYGYVFLKRYIDLGQPKSVAPGPVVQSPIN